MISATSKEEKIKFLLENTSKSHRWIASDVGCSASVVSRVRRSYDCVRDRKFPTVHNIQAQPKKSAKPNPPVKESRVHYNWILTSTNVTIVGNNMSQYTADSTHNRFSDISKCVFAGKIEDAISIIDVKESIIKWSDGRVTIVDNELTLDGQVIHNTLSARIIKEVQKQNYGDVNRYVNFMKKLDQNPNSEMFEDLFNFVVHADIEIDPSGDIIAYKRVRDDHYDFFTKTFLNKIGETVKMKRRDCDSDRTRTCSSGLHVCAMSYLKHYYGGHGVVLKVKINPKDFVAIPVDYKNTKARVCEYTPIEFFSENI